MSKIRDFYEGQHVFVTGGSGYIGKILIEKLLRACPEIGTIYLLMRPKKGKTIQERLHHITSVPMFDPLRKKNPDFQNKIIAINGDVQKPGLGLSADDRVLLIKEVSIVFHAAATTRFDEPLRVAVPINVNSVLEIIDICRQCKKLKAGVYLSSAFSQCTSDHIEEKVYPFPLTYEQINDIVQIIERRNFSKDEEVHFTNSLLGRYPNTYVLTKATAESLLNEQARGMPFCIFRFSIALATYKEPLRGWVDALQGLNQALMGIGLGTIHVACINKNARVDIVPTDFTCNAAIASAWETGTVKNDLNNDLPVYNFVSGTDNPIIWSEYRKLFQKTGPLTPPTKMVYFPTAFFCRNPILYVIFDFFLHLIPALLGDGVLRLMGRKPKLHKIYKKGHKLFEAVKFFMIRDWTFDTNRVRSMWNRLSDTDKELMPFDIKTLDWNDAIFIFWRGIVQYTIKDDFSPEGRARANHRYKMLYLIHLAVQFFFATFCIWLIWKLFCGCSLSFNV